MDQEFATNREELKDRAYSPLKVATVLPGFKLNLTSTRSVSNTPCNWGI